VTANQCCGSAAKVQRSGSIALARDRQHLDTRLADPSSTGTLRASRHVQHPAARNLPCLRRHVLLEAARCLCRHGTRRDGILHHFPSLRQSRRRLVAVGRPRRRRVALRTGGDAALAGCAASHAKRGPKRWPSAGHGPHVASPKARYCEARNNRICVPVYPSWGSVKAMMPRVSHRRPAEAA
jgi:hypothetical protein